MIYQLAQVNIARALAPLDDPLMAEFVGLLDHVNAVADASPGFVWRLQTPEGNATALRPFDDNRIIVNMSVWESLDALVAFTYRSAHRSVMQRRREWFGRYEGAFLALWWVPVGYRPSVDDARERLEHLRRRGETPFAFSFKQPFPPPLAPDAETAPELETCIP